MKCSGCSDSFCVVLITVGDGLDYDIFIVGDHANDIRPRTGIDCGELVIGVTSLVIVPTAVIIPAFKLIAICTGVIVGNIESTQVDCLADIIVIKFN